MTVTNPGSWRLITDRGSASAQMMAWMREVARITGLQQGGQNGTIVISDVAPVGVLSTARAAPGPVSVQVVGDGDLSPVSAQVSTICPVGPV